MPGGVGRVSEGVLSAGSRRVRSMVAVGNANEIFYHLDANRVCFDAVAGCIYFVDSPGGQVRETILSTLAGLRSAVTVEQLHLDTHRFFDGARKVRLTGVQAGIVLVALRLAGVAVTMVQPR